jgi:hypothetical protein
VHFSGAVQRCRCRGEVAGRQAGHFGTSTSGARPGPAARTAVEARRASLPLEAADLVRQRRPQPVHQRLVQRRGVAARGQAAPRQQELQVCLRCRARPPPWPMRWCRTPASAPAASAAQPLQTRGQARRLQVLQDRRDHVRSAEGGHSRPLAGKGRSAHLLVHPGSGPPPLLDTTAALVRHGHVYPPRLRRGAAAMQSCAACLACQRQQWCGQLVSTCCTQAWRARSARQ